MPTSSAAPSASVASVNVAAPASSLAPMPSATPATSPGASGIGAMTNFTPACKTPFVVLFTPPRSWSYYEAAQNLTHAAPLQDKLAFFEVERDAPAIRTRKRWSADGRPVMLADGYLLVPDHEERRLPDSVFSAVSALWGEPIIWDVTTPGAAALDAETASLLGMAEGTAVLTLELVGVAASGRRLFYAFEHHDPSVVRYSLVRTVRPPWGIV